MFFSVTIDIGKKEKTKTKNPFLVTGIFIWAKIYIHCGMAFMQKSDLVVLIFDWLRKKLNNYKKNQTKMRNLLLGNKKKLKHKKKKKKNKKTKKKKQNKKKKDFDQKNKIK